MPKKGDYNNTFYTPNCTKYAIILNTNTTNVHNQTISNAVNLHLVRDCLYQVVKQ